MGKAVIIDVDLSVDAIIADDVRELTTQNHELIKQVVSQAAEQQAKTELKSQAADTAIKCLAAVYQILLSAKAAGKPVPASELLPHIQELTTNLNSFALRMRAYLRHQGNQYELMSNRRHKVLYYSLEEIGDVAPAASAPEGTSPSSAP